MTSAEEPTVDVKFCLAFPREAVSVPVMRRVLGDTLRNLGVVEDCIGDILVAVTEACTNVIRHGGAARRCEIVTSVGAAACQVEVLGSGPGSGARRAEVAVPRPGQAASAPSAQPGTGARAAQMARGRPGRPAAGSPVAGRVEWSDDQMIALLAESGRGMQIMRALVDDVTLRRAPGRGTVVSMRKRVAWRRDAPMADLSDAPLRDVG